MADTLDKYLRTVKQFYELISNTLRDGKKGIEQTLFRTRDVSKSANFAIDRLITNPYGMAFRNAGDSAAVRKYVPGTGTIIEVPRTSELTEITESMRDAVVASLESTAQQSSHEMELLGQIMQQFVSAHNATKAKLSIDVIRTGIFSPLGQGGQDIGLSYDFGRSLSQSITYDFTAIGATIDEALGNLYDVYRNKEGNPDDMVVILGTQWLAELEKDTTVLTRMQTNLQNINPTMNMIPPDLMNTQGLKLIGQYRLPGRATPIWLTTYSPESPYIAYEGASEAPFFPTAEAVIFGIKATRYRVLRGIDVLNNRKVAVRQVGDLIFDTFTGENPVATYQRASSRYIFVPANIDHTGQSVGTFA